MEEEPKTNKVHPNKGRKQSPEHIAKRVASKRKNVEAVEKNRQRIIAMNKARVGEVRSQAAIEKQRAKIMGRSREWLTGRKLSVEHRRKLSEAFKLHPEHHNHYKDGKSKERHGERNTAGAQLEYRLWREEVFAQDDYRCVHCEKRGVRLQADHIRPWRLYPELRYDVSNGRTLCVDCHRVAPTSRNTTLTRKAIEELHADGAL